jgi:beta-phosphoglucomutase-like phosphatase (HAD superfamily)
MKYVIFDFDGVLGDTSELLVDYHQYLNPSLSYEEALAEHRAHFLDTHHSKKDNPTPEQLKRQAQWLSGFVDFAHSQQKIPLPVFQEFLDIVLELSIPNQAVVSSGSRDYLLPTL